MAFPKRTLFVDGKLVDSEGIGVVLYDEQYGISFDAVKLPGTGMERWTIVERETRVSVLTEGDCQPSIEEARDKLKKILARTARRVYRTKLAEPLSEKFAVAIKNGCRKVIQKG